MDPGQDPDNLFFVLDGCCDLLEEIKHTVHDERYEEIIFQALLAEYERVRNASYEKRDVGLLEIPFDTFPLQVDRRPRYRHAGRQTHQQRSALQLLQGRRAPPARLHHH